MKETSYIELNKSAYEKNVKYLKKRIGDAKFVSVVKGNAYGHGLRHFIPMAESCGIDYFAVFDAQEAAVALEVKRPESELMIIGMIDNEDLYWAILNDISFFVFEMDRLEHAIKSAKKVNKPAMIHIELETGLNRTGFELNELEQVINLIQKNTKYIHVEGVCTHFAGAESVANYLRIHEQIDRFLEISTWLNTKFTPRYRHTAGSAAALTYPHTIMDMVRFGIAQYGFWPSKETRMYNLLSDDTTFTHDPLHRVLSWKSRIMNIKPVKPGQFISYGNSYLATKEMKIAAIPVGYSHGYSRLLSNQGHVLIHGRKADVIGVVNMNMFLVNVTNIPEAKKGDQVTLIGTHGKQNITVACFAELSNHVNYELLTRLPNDIPRITIKHENTVRKK